MQNIHPPMHDVHGRSMHYMHPPYACNASKLNSINYNHFYLNPSVYQSRHNNKYLKNIKSDRQMD